MSATFSVRLDFSRAMLTDHAAAVSVAEILTRPCFSALQRVSGRRKDKWFKHAPSSREVIATYLCSTDFDAVCFETGRGLELAASAEIENGLVRIAPEPSAISLSGYLVIPFVEVELSDVCTAVCELAELLEASAGHIALEPDFSLAKRVALGGFRPKPRPGLDDDRQRSRRAREWKRELITTQIASVEWGTFLGPGHLPTLDLTAVRASGAFERVVSVSPSWCSSR